MNREVSPVQVAVILVIVLAVIGFLGYKYVWAGPGLNRPPSQKFSSRAEMLQHLHGAGGGGGAEAGK